MSSGRRHRTKLFGGRYTAEEVHAAYAFPHNTKCNLCSAKPIIRAITMCELSEAQKNPAIAALSPELLIPRIVSIRGSDGLPVPYVRMGIAYSCRRCQPALEKTLAKTPSHWIVEINKGPAPDQVFSHA